MGNEQSSQGQNQGYARAPSYPGNAGGGAHSSSSVPSAVSEATLSAEARAAALEARMGKRRPKPKDREQIKQEHWRKYDALGKEKQQAQAQQQNAAPQPGHRLGDSAAVRSGAAASTLPTPSAPPASSSVSTAPPPSASAKSPYAGVPYINRSSAAPSAAEILSGQKRYETPEEAAIRAQRAARFSTQSKTKTAKAAQAKQERWKAYSELDSASSGKSSDTSSNTLIVNAPLPFGFPTGGDGAASSGRSPSAHTSPDSFYATPTPTPPPSHARAAQPAASSSAASASAVPPAPAPAGEPDQFQQQMAYLLGKVAEMPPHAVALLRKILQNLLKAGDTPDAAGQKFRRLKLSNPKISELVAVDGVLELLFAVGFETREVEPKEPPQPDPTSLPSPTAAPSGSGAGEHFLVFPDGMPLDIAQLAVQELAAFMPPP